MRLRLTNLNAGFGTQPVVSDISFDVAPGELVTILGASGSGKTTLLRAIAGLHPARSGHVLLGDQDVTNWPAQKRRVGLVPQEGALFPHRTVASNIGYGVPRARRVERVAHMLDLIGLSDRAAAMPHELSGGQRQRVALARALAPAPPVLLLDEPFSSLDAELRGALRVDIARILAETKTAAVLVTHDVAEALTMSDRIAVLEESHILALGTPTELYERPPTRSVAEKLGPASFLPGQPVDEHQVQTALGVINTFEPLATSEQVLAMVRPEQVRLTSAPQADSYEGTTGGLAHKVLRTEFRGDTQLVFVEPAAGVSLRVHAHPSEKWVPGDDVHVQVLQPVHIVAPSLVG